MAVSPNINKMYYNNVILTTTYDFYLTKRTVIMPKRRIELYDLTGRNGAWVQDGIYATNATITYEGWMVDDTHAALNTRVKNMITFIYRQSLIGYQRLSDDYDEGFRLAVPYGAPEINYTCHGTAATIKLTFSARPELYDYTGEVWKTFSDNSSLRIDSVSFNCFPYMETTSTGTIDLVPTYPVTHRGFRITVNVDDEIIHDFEHGSATFKNGGESASNYVSWVAIDNNKIAIPYLIAGSPYHTLTTSGLISGRIKTRTYHF